MVDGLVEYESRDDDLDFVLIALFLSEGNIERFSSFSCSIWAESSIENFLISSAFKEKEGDSAASTGLGFFFFLTVKHIFTEIKISVKNCLVTRLFIQILDFKIDLIIATRETNLVTNSKIGSSLLL